MNSRRTFVARIVVLVAVPLISEAQTATRVFRIGVLLITSRAHPGAVKLLQPFEQGLRELGYVEGRNLFIEWREAEGRPERLAELAADLVARKVDLIVAGAPEAALAAMHATETIPIVFVASIDPVGQRLVKSLARPGNNVTGFGSVGEAILGKRLELLREVVPHISRVGVIHSPNDSPTIPALRDAGTILNLKLQLYEISAEAQLESVFRAISQERNEGLLVYANTITYVHRKRIIEFAAAQRLPAIYGLAEFAEAGGLISYSPSYSDNWRRTVAYVDKILKGAKPADLPVQQPTTLELIVNLRTASSLGLVIPQPVLVRTLRFIE